VPYFTNRNAEAGIGNMLSHRLSLLNRTRVIGMIGESLSASIPEIDFAAKEVSGLGSLSKTSTGYGQNPLLGGDRYSLNTYLAFVTLGRGKVENILFQA